MKVLVLSVESPIPAHGGSRVRILQLARQLSTIADVDVVALGPVPPADGEPFRLIGVPHPTSRRRALFGSWRRPYLAALFANPSAAELVRAGGWDVVQTSSTWLVDEARAAGVPVVLDAHNVEEEIMRSLATSDDRWLHRLRFRWEATKTSHAEAAAVALVDAVVACSEADAAALREAGATRALVVANGVDTAGIEHRLPAPGSMLLYVGELGYRPNEAAAIQLADEVLPQVRERLPEASLRIVGRRPGRHLIRRRSAHVEVLGDVPEVVPHHHAARVLVVPLRAGSGSRLKILEAMAAGLPVVTTALGIAGIDADGGRHVLIGETSAELAELARRVITDDDLAESLSTEARRLVEQRYDWKIVAQPLLDLHRELLGRSR